MSKRGTWCDNIFDQGGCSAYNCTIHISDANPNSHDEPLYCSHAATQNVEEPDEQVDSTQS